MFSLRYSTEEKIYYNIRTLRRRISYYNFETYKFDIEQSTFNLLKYKISNWFMWVKLKFCLEHNLILKYYLLFYSDCTTTLIADKNPWR